MPISLEEAASFHGHLGPFLYLGYKAGELVRKIFDLNESEKNVKAIIKLPLRRPITCIIDGFQCSSGLTLGKLNLIIEHSDEYKIIIERKSKRLIIQFDKDILDHLEKFENMEEAIKWLESLGISRVLKVNMQ